MADERDRIGRLEQSVRELQASLQHYAELGITLSHFMQLLATPPRISLKPEDSPRDSAKPPKPIRFQIPEWRTYAGFRADMQRREQIQLELQRRNGRIQPITKELLAGQRGVGGGDSVRSITRAMKFYGLDPLANWPPSAWPEEQPAKRPRDLHSLAAAALLPAIPLLLDVISDGRLNHVVSVSRMLGCEILKLLA